MTIYSALSGKTLDEVEKELEGLGYGALKEAVGEAAIAQLSPLQKRYEEIRSDKEYLNRIMEGNAAAANANAMRMLSKVYRKIGLAPRKI